jgi:hypothetical protein
MALRRNDADMIYIHNTISTLSTITISVAHSTKYRNI